MPPSYVLDDMQLHEVPYLVKQIERHQHPAWERARYTSIIVANSMGAKIKPKDLQFPWEETRVEEVPDLDLARKKLAELKQKK